MIIPKTLNLTEDDSPLAKAARDVQETGTSYLIQQNGLPVAMVVPVDPEAARRAGLRRLGELMEKVAERHRDIPPDEIEAMINEVVSEVRSEIRGGLKPGRDGKLHPP